MKKLNLYSALKKNGFRGALLCFLIILLNSCSFGWYQFAFTDDTVDDRVKTYDALEPSDTPQVSGTGTYSFLVVSDMHFGSGRNDVNQDDFYAKFTELVQSGETEKIPRFVINLGDTSDDGSAEYFEQYNEWCARVKSIALAQTGDSSFKVYTLIGNHDLYHDGQENFIKLVYPNKYAYYFDFAWDNSTEGFGFYFLDSANGTLSNTQYELVSEKMKSDSRPKIVLTHYPVYAGGHPFMLMHNTLERAKILSLFADNSVKAIFAGHAHQHFYYDYGDFFEYVIQSYRASHVSLLVTVNEADGSVTEKMIEF